MIVVVGERKSVLFIERNLVIIVWVIRLTLLREIQSSGCSFGNMLVKRISSSGRDSKDSLEIVLDMVGVLSTRLREFNVKIESSSTLVDNMLC